MRCFMFSLTALFLLACGDTDNPVVPTAPAGKATVDLSAEECAAAESLPDGFLEQALAVNADLDAELLLSTWQAHGCADWALWGLIWLESLDAEPIFDIDIEVYTPSGPVRAAQEGDRSLGDRLLDLADISEEDLTPAQKSDLAGLLAEARTQIEIACDPDQGTFHHDPANPADIEVILSVPNYRSYPRDEQIFGIPGLGPEDFRLVRYEVRVPCDSRVIHPE